MQHPIVELLCKITKIYNIPISCRSIEQVVLTHPNYPSLQCVSDALDSWKVRHVVVKLSLEKLRALDVPVIAHLKKREYVWVTRITDSKVHYRGASGKEKTWGYDRFEQEWSGVALAIEDLTDAGEANYKKEIKEGIFKGFIASSFAVLLIVLMCFSWTNDTQTSFLPKLLLFIFNAIGCYISYILIRQEKRQSSALSNKFCKIGKHIDCREVTSSQYSSFLNFISWAELGAVCFGSMLFWVAITPLSNDCLSPLWWFSLLVLPFTLWSLFVQAFIIRKWCLFCCSVVLLLWTNAAVLTVFYSPPAIITIPNTALWALLFIACLAVVLELSKTIGQKEQLYAQQRETAKIKYDILTMQAQLLDTTYTIDNIGFAWSNPGSAHDIGLYVSTACSHCGKAVQELKRLTDIYPGISFRLIYAVNPDNPDNESNVIVRHFINLYKTMDKNAFFDMLDAWYSTLNKKLEALQQTYPVPSVQNNTEEMDVLYQFNQQSKISYTPAILLNGQLFSKLYSYTDLYGIVRALNAED